MTPRPPRPPWPDPAGRPARPTERRLHDALAARADAVTVRALRPAAPPGPHPRRPPLLHHVRRRIALPLAGLAAAAALVAGWSALAPDPEPHRVPAPPAAPDGRPTPRPTPPTPSASPPPSTAVPSPSAPADADRGAPSATPNTPG
ncbi:hypothetical protein [Streptomyces sp. NPDC088785]|uniref:hypothetical protein n=1 Tax=Streptomyces sp. NPDC088785 TaxID=3365897 RepID=UPI00380F6DDB